VCIVDSFPVYFVDVLASPPAYAVVVIRIQGGILVLWVSEERRRTCTVNFDTDLVTAVAVSACVEPVMQSGILVQEGHHGQRESFKSIGDPQLVLATEDDALAGADITGCP
jgi:hypothetical protein